MTAKSDFTEEEWDRVLEGPPAAGMIVSTAERGGSFRAAASMAKAYAEARRMPGGSELLDEITSAKPKVDRTRHASPVELRRYSLDQLRGATALLEAKATPDEVEEYRAFVLSVAEHAAAAKKEGDQAVSEAERTALDEIAEAIGSRS